MKRIGIALGAGGARGLAHIVVLQAFEELGIRPSVISGTSMGAVIGAAFAAGLSTKEMKDAVEEIRTATPGRLWRMYDNEGLRFALALLDPTMDTGGLVKGEKFIKFLEGKIKVRRFEDLKIPLMVIATDYWRRKQVVLNKGDLMKAVRASYSMPGLFIPVKVGRNFLVDGGLMNPLPYDVLEGHCEITVAVDVSIKETAAARKLPHAQEVLFSAFQILQNSIVREKLIHRQPDCLIKTDIKNVRALEFGKAKSIYAQALLAKEELKTNLERVLSDPPSP
jgi:NTE family protein